MVSSFQEQKTIRDKNKIKKNGVKKMSDEKKVSETSLVPITIDVIRELPRGEVRDKALKEYYEWKRRQKETDVRLHHNLYNKIYRHKWSPEQRKKHQDNVKKYREIHRAEIRERRLLFYRENRERLLQKNREYYYKNKARILEKNREYYHATYKVKESNKVLMNNRSRKYYAQNRDLICEKRRIRYREKKNNGRKKN